MAPHRDLLGFRPDDIFLFELAGCDYAQCRGTSTRHYRNLLQISEPEALRAWYAKHLGVVSQGDQGTMFRWHQPDSPYADNFTAWCIFPASTTYFHPSQSPLMVNYVVPRSKLGKIENQIRLLSDHR
jgi:hypothetical protein